MLAVRRRRAGQIPALQLPSLAPGVTDARKATGSLSPRCQHEDPALGRPASDRRHGLPTCAAHMPDGVEERCRLRSGAGCFLKWRRRVVSWGPCHSARDRGDRAARIPGESPRRRAAVLRAWLLIHVRISRVLSSRATRQVRAARVGKLGWHHAVTRWSAQSRWGCSRLHYPPTQSRTALRCAGRREQIKLPLVPHHRSISTRARSPI